MRDLQTIKTIINDLYNNAEEIILSKYGITYDEKLERNNVDDINDEINELFNEFKFDYFTEDEIIEYYI